MRIPRVGRTCTNSQVLENNIEEYSGWPNSDVCTTFNIALGSGSCRKQGALPLSVLLWRMCYNRTNSNHTNHTNKTTWMHNYLQVQTVTTSTKQRRQNHVSSSDSPASQQKWLIAACWAGKSILRSSRPLSICLAYADLYWFDLTACQMKFGHLGHVRLHAPRSCDWYR